jgi:transposase-like protein
LGKSVEEIGREYGVSRASLYKRLHRVYKKLGLPLRSKVKPRVPARIKETLVVPGEFLQIT